MGGCATCGEQSIPETELKVPNVSKFLQDDMFGIYSMNGCPYCEKVKELMRLTKQQFVVYTLERKHIGGAAELAQYFKEKSLPK